MRFYLVKKCVYIHNDEAFCKELFIIQDPRWLHVDSGSKIVLYVLFFVALRFM